jgi:hypothetical protein
VVKQLPAADEIVALAQTLRPIDPSLLKAMPPGRRAEWWRGQEPYFDAFFEHDEHGLAFLEVTLRGRSLRWDRARGKLKTGATDELDGGTMQPQSKLVVDDRDVDQATLAVVLALLSARAGEPSFDAARAVVAAAAIGAAT